MCFRRNVYKIKSASLKAEYSRAGACSRRLVFIVILFGGSKPPPYYFTIHISVIYRHTALGFLP